MYLAIYDNNVGIMPQTVMGVHNVTDSLGAAWYKCPSRQKATLSRGMAIGFNLHACSGLGNELQAQRCRGAEVQKQSRRPGMALLRQRLVSPRLT